MRPVSQVCLNTEPQPEAPRVETPQKASTEVDRAELLDVLADLRLVVAQARRYEVIAPAFIALNLLFGHIDASGRAHDLSQSIDPDVSAWYFGADVLARRGSDICMWTHTGSVEADGKAYVSYLIPVKTSYGSTHGWTLLTVPIGSHATLER